MRARAVSAAVMGGAVLASAARGQVFTLPVTSTWQISTNNGASWNSGETQVPLSTSSVRVRMVVSWTPPVVDPLTRLVAVTFDGYVRGLNGAGAADSVTSLAMLQNGAVQAAPSTIVAARVATDLIKIDRGDSLPLGEGGLVQVVNSPLTGALYGTPVTGFEYRLQLDGSSGARELGLVHGIIAAPVGVATALPPGFTSLSFQALTERATLVVVPSPAGLAVLGVASGVLLRRRRR